ncbi:MAG: MFS transporter [Anaerolineae bacterium]|nr:MFS transporter [Anaerolineae bacterium]
MTILSATSSSPPLSSLERWQIRFFTIWGTQALSQIGSSVVQFALVWWITQTVGSATALAIASMMGLLPQVLLGPFAGALVDRWNRKRVMLAADTISMMCVMVLAYLFATGQAQIWHAYGLMFIRSCCGAFQGNALHASTALLVPETHLARIAGLNQMLQGGLGILTPIIAALLLVWLPLQGILMIDVITALPALTALAIFIIPQPVRDTSDQPATNNLLQDMREGLTYVLGWRGLLHIVLMAMLINFLLTPTGALMPLLVTRHFGGQVADLAKLESALGLFVIIGGLVLGAWGGFKHPKHGRIITSMLGLVGLAAGVLLIGLAPASAFWMAMVGIAIVGFMQVMCNGPMGAIFQATIPNHMQGRVGSLVGSVCMLMAPISLAVSGPLSDLIGIQVWYIAGGIACIVLAASAVLSPAVMNIEAGREAAS